MSPPALSRFTDADLGRLEALVGPEAVRTDPTSLERYGRDETEDFFFPPEAAVLPGSTEEVAAVLRMASERRLAVTPRGGGTGLSGGALPVAGGIVLSVERLDRIHEVSVADGLAVAETGVVTGELQRQVEEVGLFYPPDPASRDSCLLAGNLAEDSAGPRSLKYGTTRAWVLGLEAVLADGRVIHTGGRTRKNAAGYGLTQLLVGSEGTLAVLTAATLRLTAKPGASLTLLVPFSELEQAAAAVSGALAAGLDPAACELVEEGALAAVAAVEPLPPALVGQAALLFFELHGDALEELLGRAERLGEVTAALGGQEPLVALDAAQERRLWAIRRKVGEAVKHRSVYKEVDAVVPRSNLAPLVRAARAAASRHGLEAICYGHAGDGNLHVNLLRGSCDPADWQTRRDLAEAELLRQVVALGGTITGEHGVGWTQRRHLPTALDPATLGLMRQLKAAFDPLGILNPGKIFPEG